MKMNRRQLLAGAAAMLPGTAWALGDASKVDVCEIVLPSGTVSRPTAWERMLYTIQRVSSVEVAQRVVQVAPEDPELFEDDDVAARLPDNDDGDFEWREAT